MNEFQNRKLIPGCMGRMINIFDLSAGLAGTKLLTDKPHRDGSPTRRNRPEVVKKKLEAQIEDKPVVSEVKKKSSSKKLGGTPMKMLIDQEMSRETESKRKPPSVVAKLMGLDALPVQQQGLTSRRSLQEGYSHNTSLGEFRGCRQQEDGYFADPRVHENDYKDVYEVRQQPSKINCSKDHSLQKVRSNENPDEKRMALVRQKFMDAKRLATDEKLLQSKEFQDALEVLSSNRDLFLKFLEEPNSLFSKQLNDLHSIPLPPQMKRITVLKPSKTVETKGEKQVKKQQHPTAKEFGRDVDKPYRGSNFSHPKAENLAQPTRIVVLKPSPRKSHEIKALAGCPISSPKLSEGTDFYKGLESDEAIGSREVAREISQQMRESLSSNRRDESLLSSVFSNGYVGDESSFNRSENEYIEEDTGNFSDSEIMTPTSRHSWDYINYKFSSPCSFSSVSRASYSPESSVIKEAKKRLSERWALVASNGVNQEQRQVRRSSSTLGEMLAIPEVKNEEGSDKRLTVSSSRSFSVEEDLSTSASGLSNCNGTKDGGEESSPRSLSRSKSVPVSSSMFENIELDVKPSESLVSKSVVTKDVTKSKGGKSSFKGKVSSLFFSRNRKLSREKSLSSPLARDEDRIQSSNTEPVAHNDLSRSVHSSFPQEISVATPNENSGKGSCSTVVNNRSKSSNSSLRDALSLEKCLIHENPHENQDHPSPSSVLEAPFEDDANSSLPQSSQSISIGHPQALCRSTPIESLARTLSWDESRLEASPLNPLKSSKVFSKIDIEEKEQEWFILLQKLLSLSGLDKENSNKVFSKWHSPSSPLDPSLLDKFLDRKEEEAKCRERRSNQRLLFDCVNAALLDIGQAIILGAHPWARACDGVRKDASRDASVVDEVCRIVRDCFSGEGRWTAGETEKGNAGVDRVLRMEVCGRGWSESIRWEMDEIGQEIGGQVLEELVGEALEDLTHGCL